MKYYPVFLDIKNRRCVVIGGGEVAERKVDRLLACGADVVVVSRQLTAKLRASVNEGKIDHISDDYKEAYIGEAALVIGATDSESVNEEVFRDSRDRGILVNIVDDPGRCDFIVPSVVERGDLSIAISTGGTSPALAKNLREKLEGQYGDEYGILLKIMGAVRGKIIARGESSLVNKQVFESILASDILRYIRENDRDRVSAIIRDIVGEDMELEYVYDSESAS